jgi:PIN domain nuclease of toxin-antitoxin system
VTFLLDTHLLLRAAAQPERVSAEARGLLLDPDSFLLFSSVSIWEVTIKNTLSREDFQVDPRRPWRMLVAPGYAELGITAQHAVTVGTLPPLHKDPFDRMLVSQAKTENIPLLTSDALVAGYGEPVRLV